MRLFAIGDLHLSGHSAKPMDVFGSHWSGYWEQITADWTARVRDEDVVLVPGDISWAMTTEEARVDLEEIGALPGRKLILKGNHDYWWHSLAKVKQLMPQSIDALQNNSFCFDDIVIAGTRGWLCPNEYKFDAQDKLVYEREVQRLELSLKSAVPHLTSMPRRLVVMMHYPPFQQPKENTGFTELLKAYGVHTLVYGHLHGDSIKYAFEGLWQDTEYSLVSCDRLGFRLKEIVF